MSGYEKEFNKGIFKAVVLAGIVGTAIMYSVFGTIPDVERKPYSVTYQTINGAERTKVWMLTEDPRVSIHATRGSYRMSYSEPCLFFGKVRCERILSYGVVEVVNVNKLN